MHSEVKTKTTHYNVEIADLTHSQDLDAFVRQHPNCHFMQTSLWGRIKKEWNWHGLILRDDNGTIKGTMAMLEHRINKLQTSMFYAPRGPIFDDGDSATCRALIQAGKTYAKKQGAYLLRIDPMISDSDAVFTKQIKKLGFRCNQANDFSLFQPRMCYVLDLQNLTKDTLTSGYHRTTRYKVNRSLHSDMTVRIGNINDIPRFYKMMQQVGKKNDFPVEPQSFFENFLTESGDNAQLFLAEKDNYPIAAAIMVHMADRAWFMYGCSDQNALDDNPNERLQWEMQRTAIDLGCKFFDFRGVEGLPDPSNPKYGLHRYKQGFGADFCSYIGQLDLYLRPLTATVIRTAQAISAHI